MECYESLLTQLKKCKKGILVFLVILGDPGIKQSSKAIGTLIEIDADAPELGIPFSGPSVDGPTVQDTTPCTFAVGVAPVQHFEVLALIRQKHPAISIGFLTYTNLVLSKGIDKFHIEYEKVSVDSVLAADMPVEESAPFRQAALCHNVAFIFIRPPDADDDLLRQIVSYSRGYTCLLLRAGVTGTGNRVTLPPNHLVVKLKGHNAAPPLRGSGISVPDQARVATSVGAAGAISDSAIVKTIEQHISGSKKILVALKVFA